MSGNCGFITLLCAAKLVAVADMSIFVNLVKAQI